MARLSLSLFFVLAAAAVAVAAISAQARSSAAPFHPIRFINRHQPPSVGKNHASGHHHAHHHHHHPPASAPSPATHGVSLPPEPYPGFYKCLEKVNGVCGSEIYRGIFGNEEVSARCCVELVGLGRRCHRGIIKATLALPEMTKADKKKIKARDVEIWSQCVFITNLKAGGKSGFPILP